MRQVGHLPELEEDARSEKKRKNFYQLWCLLALGVCEEPGAYRKSLQQLRF